MNDISKLFERAEQARDLKSDPAYQFATAALQAEWSNEILLDQTDDARKLKLIERIKALEAITARLQILMNDYHYRRRAHA
jgi:hypothetical protein